MTAAYTARARTLGTKIMFWALAGVTFSAAKIVSCNKIFFFMVYLRHYFNCSTLETVPTLLNACRKLSWRDKAALTVQSCGLEFRHIILFYTWNSPARQTCPADLPGRLARQTCRADLPGRLAGQTCRADLPGRLAGQTCRADLPGRLAKLR
jgi:hypothetical protein